MEALMSMTGVTGTSQEPNSAVQSASKIKEELAKRMLNDQDNKPMDKVAATAAAQAMAMKSFLEKLNMNFALNPPPQIEMRPSKIRSGNNVLGVWTKDEIPSGMRYGPFLGKWALDVTNKDFAWEVLVPSAGIRGFLDASEYGSWLKHVQCVPEDNLEQQNITYTMVEGQIYYETLRDIREGVELALGPKRSIILDQNDNAATNGLGLDSSKSSLLDRPEGSSEDGTIDRDEHHHSEGEDTNHAADGEEDEDDDEAGAKCIKCEKIFPDISLLDHHMVEAHSHTPNQYRCEHCSESFAWRPNLLRHKMIHGEFRRFPCENCDKVFTDPSNLQRHIRTNHVGARSHACPECGKTFATSSGLKQHTHIHSSVKPFRCEVCFKSYTQFSNLCRHKRMHANCRMQIKCHKCGQAFSTVTSLSKHRRFCDSTPSPYLALAASAHHSSSTNGASLSPKGMNTSSAASSPLSKMGAESSSHDFSSVCFGKSLGTPTPPVSSSNAGGAGMGLNAGHGHSLAMSQAAAASLLSPYAAAHFLQQKHHQQQQQQQSTNALAALAMAGVQNNPFASFFQSPHLLLPNVLHRLANQQQLLSQPGIAHGFPVGLPGSIANGSRPQSLSPPSSSLKRKASERSAIIERPWQDKKRLIEERPQRLSHDGSVEENRPVDHDDRRETKRESPSYSQSVRLAKETKEDEDGEVDVNRNVSLEEKRIGNEKMSEDDEAVEEQKELAVKKPEEPENGVKEESSESSNVGPALDLSRTNLKPTVGKASFPQGIRPVKEDSLKRSHKSEADEEELEEPEEDEEIDDDEEDDNDHNEEDGEDFEKINSDPERSLEPKGFQPVKDGKAFVPVKEKVGGFLARKGDHQPHHQHRHHQHPHHQASEERFGGDRFPNSHALDGAGHFSPKSFSSSPASYPPRPIHPFLLEAMYRMHHRPSSGAESTTPFPGLIPDHGTLNGNASVPPRFPSYFPPSSMMMSGSRALEERSFFPSRCYPDLIAGMGSKSNKDRYSCKFCGKVFPRSANLTRHLRTHTGEQPYKCKYCERSFSISSNLQRHVRNIHNKEKPFKCPLCDRSFGQQTNLDRHLKKHETCSDPSAIVDSPEGPRGAEEEGYFDEIRSFMGKVTDQQHHPFSSEYSPRHSDADIDVEDEEDEISLEQE